jgi:hypothetical protein
VSGAIQCHRRCPSRWQLFCKEGKFSERWRAARRSTRGRASQTHRITGTTTRANSPPLDANDRPRIPKARQRIRASHASGPPSAVSRTIHPNPSARWSEENSIRDGLWPATRLGEPWPRDRCIEATSDRVAQAHRLTIIRRRWICQSPLPLRSIAKQSSSVPNGVAERGNTGVATVLPMQPIGTICHCRAARQSQSIDGQERGTPASRANHDHWSELARPPDRANGRDWHRERCSTLQKGWRDDENQAFA